jgi:nucleotide-binding universal stress UspA family protein
LGENIVVAWNGRREAARALSDADSLIDLAKRVTVVTVDAKPGYETFGSTPGADIAAHLARRGVNVELRNVDGMGRGDAGAILDECAAVGADLLVMGGYGSSRLQEMVFGGVTRELSKSAPLPILMSH